MNILKENVEPLFREKLKEKEALNVADALELMIDFYNEHGIASVDRNIPGDDMLLFEYGIYDWQDGKGENYTVDTTRQFYVEDGQGGGYAQLHLVLYFNTEEYRHLEAANKWSQDFASIDEWKKHVVNSDGFKLADGKAARAFEIFLVEPD